ncbi:MAG: hypothetical protein JWM31_28 [Solirubrobacterales bacterium]|nr:hypothetical protein [Solirubrobacterales bacterium]
MQHRQAPIMTVLSGTDAVDLDAQERAAWSVLADACHEALRCLDPYHPQRGEMTAMLSDFRQAAGRQPEPALGLVG